MTPAPSEKSEAGRSRVSLSLRVDRLKSKPKLGLKSGGGPAGFFSLSFRGVAEDVVIVESAGEMGGLMLKADLSAGGLLVGTRASLKGSSSPRP
jgi:hypothetical protein